MNNTKYKRIIDYFSHVLDISYESRREFEKWIILHENDPKIEAHLYETWAERSATISKETDERGLLKIVNEINKSKRRIRRVQRYTTVAVALVAFFFGGYWFAAENMEPEHKITLLTAKGHIGEFTLPDGSEVWLNSGSKLTYNEGFSNNSRDVALSGEAFFEVQQDSLRPFRVEMDGVQVEVIGTSFDAINNDFSPTRSVILKTGCLKVYCDLFPQEIRLAPGEKIDVNKRTGQISLNTVDPQNYCQWFNTRLIFDNTPLSDVITNLERRYNIKIAVSSKVSLDRRLSIIISNEPVEDVMNVLCSLLPISYELEDNLLTIM